MAYTVSAVVNTVFGDKRVRSLKITADAATQTVESGLEYIDAFSVGIQSVTTAGGLPAIYANSNASGVQSFGVLGISNLASGDELFVTVYGR